MSFDESQVNTNQPDQAQAPSAPAAANPPVAPNSPSTPPATPPLGANDAQQPQQAQASDGSQHVSNPGPITQRGVQDPSLLCPLSLFGPGSSCIHARRTLYAKGQSA